MYKRLILLTGVILLVTGCKGVADIEQYDDEKWDAYHLISGEKPTPPVKENTYASSKDWGLRSDHIMLIDLTDDEILYSKNESQKTYPASLTKMMTVLVAIENMTVDTMKTIPDYTHLYEENASLAGFLPNDTVSSVDLLYGTMLPSGADAALSLAENIAGSEQAFVKLMNQKAKSLGMIDTHFANVTGLHDPNHYTTVKDLSILLKEALKNSMFKEVFTAQRYSTDSSANNPNGMTFSSRLFSKLESPLFKGGKFLGGKTGYTQEAGLCLASLATDGDNEYILITTHAIGDAHTEQFNITDAINLYERFLS